MPFYEYTCKECGNEETKMKHKPISSDEDKDEKCEKCKGSLTRGFSTSNIDCPPHHVKDCDLSYDSSKI